MSIKKKNQFINNVTFSWFNWYKNDLKVTKNLKFMEAYSIYIIIKKKRFYKISF